MSAAAFKSFGYRYQTQMTRVGMDSGANVQQMKAGFDFETQKGIAESQKRFVETQQKIANSSFNAGKKKRFIM